MYRELSRVESRWSEGRNKLFIEGFYTDWRRIEKKKKTINEPGQCHEREKEKKILLKSCLDPLPNFILLWDGRTDVLSIWFWESTEAPKRKCRWKELRRQKTTKKRRRRRHDTTEKCLEGGSE